MLFGGGNKDDKGAGGGGVSRYNCCNVYTAYSCQFTSDCVQIYPIQDCKALLQAFSTAPATRSMPAC
jgi:hypothetical protein